MLPPEDVQRLVGLALVRVLGQPIDLEAEAEAADGRPPLAVFRVRHSRLGPPQWVTRGALQGSDSGFDSHRVALQRRVRLDQRRTSHFDLFHRLAHQRDELHLLQTGGVASH